LSRKTPAPRRKKAINPPAAPFWKTKTLAQMSRAEWESLCDGCARCCLNKFEEEDTGKILFTDVACKLLDGKSCRCRDYPNRAKLVKDCVRLTPRNLPKMNCLPPTCAYRLVQEGKDLYSWHPLISGRAASVHEAGISVRGRTVSETGFSDEEMLERIVTWPKRRS
jgi:uncharacterized cysteine cluster protein YcgN (CxxCxxCC family)